MVPVMNVLIAGCGYVGVRLAERLQAAGHSVLGLRRSEPPPLPYLRWIRGDLAAKSMDPLPVPVDAVVLAAGLRQDAEERYRQLFMDGYDWLIREVLSRHPVRRLVMVSTTGVFAENNGGWVDESSPVKSDHAPGRYYLAAEDLVRQSSLPFSIVRLSGLYGPERFRLIREVREGLARRHGPPVHFLNHLHADDAAGALAFILQHDGSPPVVVASDRDPADRDEVLSWIAHRMGRGEIPPTDDAPRPVRRSGNKRCRSDLLIRLGYRFTFPTYREGYEMLLQTGV